MPAPGDRLSELRARSEDFTGIEFVQVVDKCDQTGSAHLLPDRPARPASALRGRRRSAGDSRAAVVHRFSYLQPAPAPRRTWKWFLAPAPME